MEYTHVAYIGLGFNPNTGRNRGNGVKTAVIASCWLIAAIIQFGV